MIRTEKTTINNNEYCVTLFPAMQAYLLARKIISVLTAEQTDYLEKLIAIDPSGELLLELMSQTLVNNVAITKSTFNTIYQGNLSEVAIALIFIIKTNFPDFFGEGRMAQVMEAITEILPQLPTEKIQDQA